MSVQMVEQADHVWTGKSEDELRVELAACCQLMDVYGMTNMARSHISVRAPGPEPTFLINPLGSFFEEVTASSLIKVDMHGNVVEGHVDQLNPAGFVIHSAVHMAQEANQCVLHTHTRATVAVGIMEEGLMPLSQSALLLHDFLRYHEFEGAALDLNERERIVRDLGPDGRCMLLRNHGALTVGRTAAEAFCWMFRLDTACAIQVDALSGGRRLRELSRETILRTAAQGRRVLGPGGLGECGKLEWGALIRKLERERGTSDRN